MPSVDTSIEVNAPIERVFAAWRHFERFPAFMENIREVQWTSDNTTHWVADVAGERLEWDATMDVEANRRIAWTAAGEAGHSGHVLFDPVGPGRTRLDVHIDYTLPSKLRQAVAESLGIDRRAVHDDLENFRRQIEGRETVGPAGP